MQPESYWEEEWLCLVKSSPSRKYVVLRLPRIEDAFLTCAELTKRPVDGFSAGLVDDSNLFEWQITIMGPPDTL